MPKIALLNMALGFVVVFIASLVGVFNAIDLTDVYLKGSAVSSEWQRQLLHSSHGHANLFGFLHILFGLTIPYSKLPKRAYLWLSTALFLATFAMGPLMVLRALREPSPAFEPLGILMGVFLVAGIIAIICHAFGLMLHALKRG